MQKTKQIEGSVFQYKFSDDQIIEWSKRPDVKDLKCTHLQVGDIVGYNFRFYGANINEFGFVSKIYHTVFHRHKRVRVLFYLRWYGKCYRTFDEKGDLL